MEKGVLKYWTPEAEKGYAEALARCVTFAQRHLVLSIRDLLKYDGRTRAGKRAIAQGRLRLAVATDEDLEELAEIMDEPVEELKRERAKIRQQGGWN